MIPSSHTGALYASPVVSCALPYMDMWSNGKLNPICRLAAYNSGSESHRRQIYRQCLWFLRIQFNYYTASKQVCHPNSIFSILTNNGQIRSKLKGKICFLEHSLPSLICYSVMKTNWGTCQCNECCG